LPGAGFSGAGAGASGAGAGAGAGATGAGASAGFSVGLGLQPTVNATSNNSDKTNAINLFIDFHLLPKNLINILKAYYNTKNFVNLKFQRIL
jgi:hypothetical protein